MYLYVAAATMYKGDTDCASTDVLTEVFYLHKLQRDSLGAGELVRKQLFLRFNLDEGTDETLPTTAAAACF